MKTDKIAALFANKIAVFSAHHAVQRNTDASFAFEQESYFFWLTNIVEPDWSLIIDGFSGTSYLVAPDIPDHQRLFDGALDHSAVRTSSGIEHIIDASEAKALLIRLATEHDVVYALGEHPETKYFEFVVNPAQQELWTRLSGQFKEVKDCRLDLTKIRAIKSPEEIALIQRAVDTTIDTFKVVRKKLENLRYEYEIEAELNYGFRNKGTGGHAYDPIVASGANACTLHYGQNNDALPADGLVLIDAGTRVDGYAADITRTYAVGTPSKRQVAVHQAVEQAHHKIIALLGPGVSVKEYDHQVDEIMKDALRSLDLLHTEDDYRTYFPHAISHGLGIDVHDALGRPETFQPGMVLTVEPGIYIPEEGIGVRIEDDILITEGGHENLSAKLPTGL